MSKPNRKESILKEAAVLFRQKGYAATSMRELADKIGIEAASLYNHIQSKEDILENICFRIANQYLSCMEQIETQHTCTVDKMKSLISVHVRMSLENPNEVCVAHNDWKNLSEGTKERYKALRKGYESRVEELIQQGITSGELKNVQVSVALFTLLSSFRWIELWYKNEREICPETLENDLITLLVDGYKK